ncbi:MAG: hypothetical protein SV201_04980 [Pseudomonadota bacterium]|nr:hypothetical protein [Pseudomonadota bacterium]
MSDDRTYTPYNIEAHNELPPLPVGNGQVVNLVKREADRETVLALEKLLQMAKDGELIGIGIVGLTSDGGIAEQLTSGMKEQVFAAIGTLQYLQQRLLDEIER